MQADAFRRARKLISSSGDPFLARILGAVQSLLILAILGVICLFVVLMASRGEARFPLANSDALPRWVANQGTADTDSLRFKNTGIFPLVANNLASPNPVHRVGARVVDAMTSLLPPLRNDLGA